MPTVPVRWNVQGGQAPYTLVIDHETRDEHRDYVGSSGTAQVGCADASVGTDFSWERYGRMYDADPMVDSGWKTVNATVTDANGGTAQASTEFYVLLTVGDVNHQMRGGETHRVYDRLMTAPTGTTLQIGEFGSMQGPSIQTFVLVNLGATVLLNAET